MEREKRIPNRLIHEKSPYLLQHAYNPVDWFPWGDEAFSKAVREHKPVFLSIGYSTCHWCHVMEDESFEDEAAARIINRDYVPIKVDREERPDIDAVYMSACQMLTGSGGWPLTVIMTPDRKPFFAGTYFPKESQGRHMGLLELLASVAALWKREPDKLMANGERIAREMEHAAPVRSGSLTKERLRAAVEGFASGYDRRYGGFFGAPKFPAPHNLLFLLRYSICEKEKTVLEMVETTLKGMYRGGLFDHIGGGFSRYSTDERWLIPHFEKMLYDNALLSLAYLEAFQTTGNPFYRSVAQRVLAYLAKEMTDAETGGFYSAQDADSEGVEGKYYVFTPEELAQRLGREEGEAFCRAYDITPQGNFEGRSVPNLLSNPDWERAWDDFSHARGTLYRYRQERTTLHRDDKILTAWNALAICAFAKAYEVTKTEEYRIRALAALNTVEEKLTYENGRLAVRYRDGERAGFGYLDDYAFLTWACLNLYDGTRDASHLERGKRYAKEMLRLFSDGSGGGFFLSGADGEALIAKPKETFDGAMPSGNSAAGYVLSRLARLTGEALFQRESEKQLEFLFKHMPPRMEGHALAGLAGMEALYTDFSS